MKRTLPRLLATLLCLALLFAMAACGAPDNTQSTPVSDSGSASTEPGTDCRHQHAHLRRHHDHVLPRVLQLL